MRRKSAPEMACKGERFMLERSIRGLLIKSATTTNKIVLTDFHTKHITHIIRIAFEHKYESLD